MNSVLIVTPILIIFILNRFINCFGYNIYCTNIEFNLGLSNQLIEINCIQNKRLHVYKKKHSMINDPLVSLI